MHGRASRTRTHTFKSSNGCFVASKLASPAPALEPLRGRVYGQGSRFSETATTSLGVPQSWPLALIKAFSQQKSGFP